MCRHAHRLVSLVGAIIVVGIVACNEEPGPRLAVNAEDAKKTPNADWPRWRGPNADGVAEGGKLPTRWSQIENVVWSVKLPGWGTSSPVAFGERVFVTSQQTEGGKKSLLTL